MYSELGVSLYAHGSIRTAGEVCMLGPDMDQPSSSFYLGRRSDLELEIGLGAGIGLGI